MDKKEIETLLEHWDIGDFISYEQATRGVVNINWILETTKSRYVLKQVSRFVRTSDLGFELSYLTYLKDHGFPYRTPAPIRTKNGKFVLRFKGSRFWVYEYIEGRNIKQFDYPELKECAKMMAIYHKMIESSDLDNKKGVGDVFNRRPVLKELERFTAQILGKDKQDRKDQIFLEESSILVPLIKSLDGREYSKLPTYPLHRDINPENTLWKNKRLVGLIDFENVGAGNDTLIKDISILLQYSCRDRRQKHKLDLERADFFLREYKKHHQLSIKEIEFIPDVTTAGSIEDFSYAYWMLVNDPKRAKLYRLKLYSRIAQWYHRNKQKIIRKLVNGKVRARKT
ncbi:MAG: phosphotransferase [Candidatus Bathyarchaeia archaeon]